MRILRVPEYGLLFFISARVRFIVNFENERSAVPAILAEIHLADISPGNGKDVAAFADRAAEHTNNSICASGTKISAMKTVVISLGGSILIPTLETNRIRAYVPVLKNIAAHHRLLVVVGGGGEARRYIEMMRAVGTDEGTSDEIGILITRLNATLLIAALGDAAYPVVAESHAEAKEFAESGKIVVMGGITPGQTTDAVAAVLAERVGASVFINLTSVDGIYTGDPKKDKGATRFEEMKPKKLLEVVGGTALGAGSNNVLDIVAARIVERSNIPLVVLDGSRPDNLSNAILEGKFKGTIVSESGENPFPL